MENIKDKIKKNTTVYNAYRKVKYRNFFDKKSEFSLRDNIVGKEKAVVILAGYKEVLWSNVFKRLNLFIPDDYDVCVVSSGKYSEKLFNIAKKNGWGYLSTKRNNVCVALNTAISALDKARYLLKIDEDIFVTKDTIKNMERAFFNPKISYDPGFVAPLIPINGFGFVEVLKRFNLVQAYTKRFEVPVHGAGSDKAIENNPEVAKFFWENIDLDEMGNQLNMDSQVELTCPIRFSIGIIFFEKNLWKNMGYFHVSPKGSDMGSDEVQIDEYCLIQSKPIVVSENSIAGHLSFGPQNKEMIDFYQSNNKIYSV